AVVVVHAGGDLDVQTPHGAPATFSPAGRARIPHDRPRAATTTAGLVQREEALSVNHLALAVAGLARHPRAAPRPRAFAIGAALQAGDADLLLAPESGLQEIDFQVEPEVGAPAPTGALPAGPAEQITKREAEEGPEDVLEIGEDLRIEATDPLGGAAHAG